MELHHLVSESSRTKVKCYCVVSPKRSWISSVAAHCSIQILCNSAEELLRSHPLFQNAAHGGSLDVQSPCNLGLADAEVGYSCGRRTAAPLAARTANFPGCSQLFRRSILSGHRVSIVFRNPARSQDPSALPGSSETPKSISRARRAHSSTVSSPTPRVLRVVVTLPASRKLSIVARTR